MWIWECMVIAFKSGLGAIFWGFGIAIFCGILVLIGMGITKTLNK